MRIDYLSIHIARNKENDLFLSSMLFTSLIISDVLTTIQQSSSVIYKFEMRDLAVINMFTATMTFPNVFLSD